VRSRYGLSDLAPLFELQDRLDRAIKLARVGEFDGNEVATDLSDVTLYMYGPDADRLFSAVRPVLESTDFLRGAVATLRFGPPGAGARRTTVTIGTTGNRP
jgi:hypothetical protein